MTTNCCGEPPVYEDKKAIVAVPELLDVYKKAKDAIDELDDAINDMELEDKICIYELKAAIKYLEKRHYINIKSMPIDW